MKKILFAITLLIASVQMTHAMELPELSDSVEFYMIACEPGKEAYQLFGHAAIRVVDKTQGLDLAFNWGVFSFEAPNFIGRFVVGQTDYELAVWLTESFLCEYRERGSAVHQCHINLDSLEKERLWQMLSKNYEPKNRVYRYNFIYDNCATRVVDMILASYDSIEAPSFDIPSISYRKFVNTYTHSDKWLALGIDLVFGSQADNPTTAKQSATFPLEAMELLTTANVYRESGSEPILTDHTYLCNKEKKGAWKEYSKAKAYMICIIPLVILAFMIFMFFWHKRYRYEKISTQITLWLLFALSMLILFLEFFTVHPLVDYNLNILWCSPLAGVLATILLIKHKRNMKCTVALITLLSTFSFIFILAHYVQSLSPQLFCWWIMVLGCEFLVVLTYSHHLIKSIKLYYKGERQRHRHHHRHHHHHHHHHHHEE